MGIFSFLNKYPKTVENKNFSGVVFSENYNLRFITSEKRFTPSDEDIIKAGKLIENFLIKQNPLIFSKISRYKKQYFGIINEDGEKIIYLNAGIGFDEFEEPNWKKDYVNVFDGGDNFFNIKINLNQEKCFDFYVNGEA